MTTVATPMPPMPPMAALLRHLADTPPEWLGMPEWRGQPGIRVSALLGDLLEALDGSALAGNEAARLRATDQDMLPALRLALLALWLLHQPELKAHLRGCFDRSRRAALLDFLHTELRQRAAHLSAETAVNQAEGREELVRQLLHGLKLLPADENASTFEYRMKARDSVEQARLVEAARAAEERARKLREAMARKAAEEAAMKYNRE